MRMTTMQELLNLCEETIIKKLKHIPNLLSHCSVYENENYTIINSPLNTSMFNIMWVKNIYTHDYKALIKEAKEIFYPNSFALWYGPTSQVKISDSHFAEWGFRKEAKEIGMYIPLTQFVPIQNECNNFFLVKEKEGLLKFLNILNEYDAYAQEYYLKILDEVGFTANTPFRYFYCDANKETTCIASLFFNNSLCGLFDVITAPSQRRKGYARQLTSNLLAYAQQQGASHMCLTASSAAAVELYYKLGFQALGHYECFEFKFDN